MVLTVSPAKPVAGEAVHFTLQATENAAACCGFVLAFGDGQEFEHQNGRSCPKEDLQPGAYSTETDYTYTTGSPKEFMFTALTESCTAPNVEKAIYGYVDVQG
jgi:hypothetical protein